MGAPFGRGAAYYDLLHADRDYAGESARLAARLRRLGARRVLELGCGTGRHALELAARGFEVSGLDRSGAMLRAARRRRRRAPEAVRRRLRLHRRDWLSPPPGPFDAAVALFHVVSYAARPRELDAVLAAAAAVLKPGGALLFDAWSRGARRPAPRERAAEGRGWTLRRRSRSAAERGGAVRVVQDFELRRAGRVARFSETHRLRPRTRGEVEAALRRAGFVAVRVRSALAGRPARAGDSAAFYEARLSAAARAAAAR